MRGFHVLHDSGSTLCFVGLTKANRILHKYFKNKRDVEIVSFEDAQTKDQAWFDARQFMTIPADIALKVKIVEYINSRNGQWFSVVDHSNDIDEDQIVGRNVFISCYNTISSNTIIRDHVYISCYCTISGGVDLGEFAYIGPYTYCCFTKFGKGTMIGIRSSFVPKPDDPIETADWCNFLMESRINMSIDRSGTYKGHRLQSDETSLDIKIL